MPNLGLTPQRRVDSVASHQFSRTAMPHPRAYLTAICTLSNASSDTDTLTPTALHAAISFGL